MTRRGRYSIYLGGRETSQGEIGLVEGGSKIPGSKREISDSLAAKGLVFLHGMHYCGPGSRGWRAGWPEGGREGGGGGSVALSLRIADSTLSSCLIGGYLFIREMTPSRCLPTAVNPSALAFPLSFAPLCNWLCRCQFYYY